MPVRLALDKLVLAQGTRLKTKTFFEEGFCLFAVACHERIFYECPSTLLGAFASHSPPNLFHKKVACHERAPRFFEGRVEWRRSELNRRPKTYFIKNCTGVSKLVLRITGSKLSEIPRNSFRCLVVSRIRKTRKTELECVTPLVQPVKRRLRRWSGILLSERVA